MEGGKIFFKLAAHQEGLTTSEIARGGVGSIKRHDVVEECTEGKGEEGKKEKKAHRCESMREEIRVRGCLGGGSSRSQGERGDQREKRRWGGQWSLLISAGTVRLSLEGRKNTQKRRKKGCAYE